MTEVLNQYIAPTSISSTPAVEESIGPIAPKDQIAQTFFTYGIKGGMFITKIDLYFFAKDDNLPVIMEIRKLVNGIPEQRLRSSNFRVSLLPASITTSSTGAVSSSFVFDDPVYIEENSDYAFVISSNSSKYHIWTAKVQERDLNTGNIITQQPYIGSMLKSENGSSWVVEPLEDIKFRIYKAAFSTSPAVVSFLPKYKTCTTNGQAFYTTKDSATIICQNLVTKHGFEVDSKVALDVNAGLFNGLTENDLTGTYRVSKVTDEYTFEFDILTTAKVTGVLPSSNKVNTISILNGGKDYSSAPTLAINSGISGTAGTVVGYTIVNGGSGYVTPVGVVVGTGIDATVTITQSGGVINGVTITDAGSGYVGITTLTITDSSGPGTGGYITLKVPPAATCTVVNGAIKTVTVTNPGCGILSRELTVTATGTGSGAELVADCDVYLNYAFNTQYSFMLPYIGNIIPSDGSITYTNVTTRFNNPGGTIPVVSTYTQNDEREFSLKDAFSGTNCIVASAANETFKMSGVRSTRITATMNTSNANTSPILDNKFKKIIVGQNIINDMPYDTIDTAVTDSTGTLTSISMTTTGSGYTTATAVLKSTNGSAVLTPTIVGNAITGITFTGGTGFREVPEIVITGDGIGAAATAIISDFNSELLPSGGNAWSKYVTRQLQLQTLSTGMRIFCNAYSDRNMNFEFYIRTSLVAENTNHKTLNWKLMNCETETNRSRSNEFLDYVFFIDGITPEFDMFDLKIVLRSKNPMFSPVIRNYRAIALAA